MNPIKPSQISEKGMGEVMPLCPACTPSSAMENIDRARLLLKSLESLEMRDVSAWSDSLLLDEAYPALALRAARKDFLTVLRLLGFIPSCPAVEHLPLSERKATACSKASSGTTAKDAAFLAIQEAYSDEFRAAGWPRAVLVTLPMKSELALSRLPETPDARSCSQLLILTASDQIGSRMEM